jgi:probable HAF family extracellular repeat protein
MTVTSTISSIVPLNQQSFDTGEGLNDSGEIIGYVPSGGTYLAAVWQSGAVTVLAPPNGASRWVMTGINTAGDISGYALGSSQGAVLWQAGAITTLATLGGSGGSATGLNNEGQVVGDSQTATGLIEAALWQNGTASNLGALPGAKGATSTSALSIAYGINDNGQIVGVSATATSINHAFLWQNGVMTDLGALTAQGDSSAKAINSQGVIIGNSLATSSIEHAVTWKNGTISDLGTLAGDNYSRAEAINNAGIIVGESANITSNGATNHAVMWQNGVITDLNSLLQPGSGWVLHDATGINDQGQITGSGYFSGTGMETGFILTLGSSAAPSVTAQTAVQSFGNHQLSAAVSITDTAANVLSSITGLLSLANAGDLQAITLSDPNTPAITLSLSQVAADGAVLNYVTSSYTLAVTGVSTSASDLNTVLQLNHPASVSLSDSAAHVAYAIDVLEYLIDGNGDHLSIALTDGGIPALAVDSTELASDAAALQSVTGSYTLTVTPVSQTTSIAGLAGHATTVQFSGNESQYTISATNSGLIVTDGSTVYTLSNVTALQFADHTDIVAQSPGAGLTTTGNITELYAAVLAREPDAAGLAYYQSYLTTNPSTPLLQFAEWFLNSPEYTSNAAHAYAQTTAGDAQFITDSYQNLLHRTPSAAEVAYYQTNVMAPALAGLAAGTQAYANAEFAAHAQMLVNFSASPEFLSDVQITSTHPADAQHWLVLG